MEILDHGYVLTTNVMGSDIDVVNAARVSYDKEVYMLSERDEGLIDFLIRNHHDSVLRHCVMTFEIYAPLMIARQWWKHHIGSAAIDDQDGWNESSRRYVTENEQFYIPNVDEWRAAAKNNKQGSSGMLSLYYGAKYTQHMRRIIKESESIYHEALADGVAPEQARLLLPAYSMYVRWRWTVSLNALLHFIQLRTHSTSQSEIQLYANAIAQSVEEHFPVTYAAWHKHRTHG